MGHFRTGCNAGPDLTHVPLFFSYMFPLFFRKSLAIFIRVMPNEAKVIPPKRANPMKAARDSFSCKLEMNQATAKSPNILVIRIPPQETTPSFAFFELIHVDNSQISSTIKIPRTNPSNSI